MKKSNRNFNQSPPRRHPLRPIRRQRGQLHPVGLAGGVFRNESIDK